MIGEEILLYDILLAVIFLVSLLPAWRLITGPSLADRAVAFDSLAMNTAGVLAIVCIRQQTDVYVEAILILALLGFLGTLAVARFIERGQLIQIDLRPEDDWEDAFHPTKPAEFKGGGTEEPAAAERPEILRDLIESEAGPASRDSGISPPEKKTEAP